MLPANGVRLQPVVATERDSVRLPVERARRAVARVASDSGMRFGVDDEGNVGISRGAVAIQLAPEEVERLTAFLSLAKPIWRPEA